MPSVLVTPARGKETATHPFSSPASRSADCPYAKTECHEVVGSTASSIAVLHDQQSSFRTRAARSLAQSDGVLLRSDETHHPP